LPTSRSSEVQLTISSVAVCPLRKCLYSRCASAGKLLSEVTCHGTSPRLSSLRALRQEHLALPCQIWKIMAGAAMGWLRLGVVSMGESGPLQGQGRSACWGGKDRHSRRSTTFISTAVVTTDHQLALFRSASSTSHMPNSLPFLSSEPPQRVNALAGRHGTGQATSS